ncbi:MAG: hypothetical protein ACI8QZ_000195 [Chlamydiales bacterium]|jgi:hypothetical protein
MSGPTHDRTRARKGWSGTILCGSIAALITACGGAPDGERSSADPVASDPWFTDTIDSSGITFVHTTGHTERYLMPENVTGGGALFDMDGDGDLDLYLIQGGNPYDPQANELPNHLYENLGDGTFRDVTQGSGTGDSGYGMGVACGDYDNDGDADIYLTNLGRNVLFRNDGDGVFVDVTAEAGVGDDGWGTSTAFLDIDRDGDLDLYVCNYLIWSLAVEEDCRNSHGVLDYCGPAVYQASARDVIYRNNGDGTFVDASVEVGLGQSFGNGLGLGCTDFNGDGWIDVFIANDLTLDQLWMNQGDGTFTDEAVFMGCAVDENGVAKAGMGVAIADIDLDGDQDMMVCNLRTETDSLYINQGGFFSDSTAQLGLGLVSRTFTRFGMGWADFDNDGLLDLYQANGRVKREDKRWPEDPDDPYSEPNVLFRGSPSGFEEVHPRGGTAELIVASSRAAIFGDIDNDGAIDIVVVNQNKLPTVLMNRCGDGGHWVTFRVVNRHGSDALGAQVRIRIGEQWIVRDIQPAYSFLASNDPRAHFGLGERTAIDEVVVVWPDGERESVGTFAADAMHEIRRGNE